MKTKYMTFFPKLWYIFLGGVILLGTVSLIQGSQNALNFSQDFHWDVARLLMDRTDPYQLFLQGKKPYTDYIVPDGFQPNQIPSSLFPLFPYTLIPWGQAKIVWWLTNLVSVSILFVTLYKWQFPSITRQSMILISACFLAGLPFRNSLGLGQHSIVAFTAFIVAVTLLEKKQDLLSGLFLAISLLKYSITLPLFPYFLYKRNLKPPLLALGIHTLIHLWFSLWLNVNPLTLALNPMQIAASVTLGGGYIDVFTLVKRYALPDAVDDLMVSMLILMVIFTAYARPAKNDKAKDLIFLTFLALVSNIIIYHAAYDFLTLIVIIVSVLLRYKTKTFLDFLGIVVLGLIWFVWRVIYALGLPEVENIFFLILSTIYYSYLGLICFHIWRRNPMPEIHL